MTYLDEDCVFRILARIYAHEVSPSDAIAELKTLAPLQAGDE